MSADGVEELKEQLIEARLEAEEPELDPTELSTADLVRELLDKTRTLARKEVELARTELKADLKDELTTLKGAAAAGVLGLCGLNMLFVCAALGLGAVIPAWLAALFIGIGLVLIAGGLGLWGYSHLNKKPLAATRRTLEEDVEWAKRRLA